MTRGITDYTQNTTAVASSNATRVQMPAFKNTAKDCPTTIQLKPKLFFFPNASCHWGKV